MTQVVSSISGIQIYAPSAGFAPTNSADVSAIASGYQVVSATATQLYAGTAYLTSVNDAPVSASRAGQAANAAMANSAYYDGTGRLISALPDEATVSSIASSYAESAASGKLDSTAQVVSALTTGDAGAGVQQVNSINGMELSAFNSYWATAAGRADYAGSSTIAYSDDNGRELTSLAQESSISSIASSYAGSAASGKADSSSLSSYALSADVSGTIDTVSSNSASWAAGISFPYGFQSGDCSAVLTTGFFANTSRPSFIISSQDNVYPRFIVRSFTGTGAKGSYYLSDAFEFTTGTAGGANSGTKVLRIDPQQVSSKNFLLFGPSGSNTYGYLALRGADNSAYVNIGSGTVEHVNYVRPSSISSWWDTHDTVSANSASWGGGVDSATVSSIASSYAESAASGKMDTSAIDYTRTGDGTQIYASGTGSSTNQFSAYNDSAGAAIIAAKNARIRLWDTAATANIYASSVGEWDAASDLVSAQSANWGASALQIAAGPGVNLTKSGSVLVAGTDETILYTANGNMSAGTQIVLSEACSSFERVRVDIGSTAWMNSNYYIGNCPRWEPFRMTFDQAANIFCDAADISSTDYVTWDVRRTHRYNLGTGGITHTADFSSNFAVMKVVGINRIA